MKKKINIFWILIGIGVLIFLLLILVSNVLDVGEKLRNINKYLEYGFYVLSVLLLFFLIINPIRIILFAPTFSIVTVLDEENNKNYKVYKKVAKTLLENKDLDENDKLKIKSGLANKEELKETISRIYDSSIKKQINKIILKNAKTVFISTAISQNGKLDMLTVLSINIKMIKDIVNRSGFRPSYAKLGKLSIRVLSTALIAENLEGLDFTDVFPQSTTSFLAEVPLVKPIASSVLNGLSNALLTLRVGICTRRYLFSDMNKVTQDDIRKRSIKESVMMLPILVKDCVSFFPEKIAKMFKKNDKNVNTSEVI